MANGTATAQGSEILPYGASFAIGFVVCLGVTIATGGKEAVDAAAYYSLGIPLMALAMLAIGYVFPKRPWRWTLSMAVGQTAAMLATGSGLSLWPIAMIMMLILSIPQFVAGSVGAYFGKRGARKSAGAAASE
jgi:hypothetical protein